MFADSPVIMIDAATFMTGVGAIVAAIAGAAWKVSSTTTTAIALFGSKLAPILISLNNIVAIVTDRYEIEIEENARLRTLIRDRDAHRPHDGTDPP